MAEVAVKERAPHDAAMATAVVVPGVLVRSLGAVLALTIATAHVADQGGVTLFTSPDWLGWAYRLIEVGGVFTALSLLWARSARIGWAAAALLGVAPFLGYVASRTVGVPGDSADVGNWGDWLGTVALMVEAALFTVSVTMLLATDPARRSAAASGELPSPQERDLTVAETWSLWLPHASK